MVFANAFARMLKMADAERHPLVDAGDDRVGGVRVPVPDMPSTTNRDLIARKQPSVFVEPDRGDAGIVEKRQAGVGQPGLNRVQVDRLQQLRLKQLALPRHLVAGRVSSCPPETGGPSG